MDDITRNRTHAPQMRVVVLVAASLAAAGIVPPALAVVGSFGPPVPTAVLNCAASTGRIIETPHVGVRVTCDGRLELRARGQTPPDGCVEGTQILGPEFGIAKDPFRREGHTDGRGSQKFHRWLIYRSAGREFIIGRALHAYDSQGSLYHHHATLTNVECGCHTATKQFWIRADPHRLPPVPQRVTEGSWRGLRFLVPLPLERWTNDRAGARIVAYGGTVVRTAKLADVVLVPDDVDFCWSRNAAAEAAIRRGARIIWEREFVLAARRPLPPAPADPASGVHPAGIGADRVSPEMTDAGGGQ